MTPSSPVTAALANVLSGERSNDGQLLKPEELLEGEPDARDTTSMSLGRRNEPLSA